MNYTIEKICLNIKNKNFLFLAHMENLQDDSNRRKYKPISSEIRNLIIERVVSCG